MTPTADVSAAPEHHEDVDIVLLTVPVLARLRSRAPDADAAVEDVTQRLAPVRGLYDEAFVERQEDDGSFWVVARFVTVSVDVHTAVVGVHETLAQSHVEVDEVWARDVLSGAA